MLDSGGSDTSCPQSCGDSCAVRRPDPQKLVAAVGSLGKTFRWRLPTNLQQVRLCGGTNQLTEGRRNEFQSSPSHPEGRHSVEGRAASKLRLWELSLLLGDSGSEKEEIQSRTSGRGGGVLRISLGDSGSGLTSFTDSGLRWRSLHSCKLRLCWELPLGDIPRTAWYLCVIHLVFFCVAFFFNCTVTSVVEFCNPCCIFLLPLLSFVIRVVYFFCAAFQ